MVAVMLGTCTGARNKLCASFLGEGAAAANRHHPPTPTISLPSSRVNFGTSRRNPREWEPVASSAPPPPAAAAMDTDQKDCLRRESASLSPHGSTSALSPSYFDNPTSPISPGGSRRGELKQCGVCGDVAKSNHFGGRSCDSCKAFFRRSVQNNAYRGFNCPYEKKCVIAKTSRKACQFCRFEKCLAIGMEKSWVMSEAERRKMMEQRQERKVAAALQQHPRQLSPQSQVLVPVASCSLQNTVENHSLEEFVLSDEMKSEIEHIEEYYKQSYKANPYSSDMTSVKGSKGVLETWMQFCKKIGHFFSLFEDFSSLCQEDQAVLLQTAMTSAGIIMGSVTYESWIGKRKAGGSAGPSIPKLSFDNIEKLVPGDLLYRVKTFFKKFQLICPDETMAKILMLVSLYSPEMAGLKDEAKVQTLQEHYINILSCYLKYKFGAKAGRMFANALVSLADVRELAERSLALEIRHSAIFQLATASSDSSSGGNSSARRGSGGGSLEGPGMGEGSGGNGGTGGYNDSSGGTSSTDGASNRDVDGVDGHVGGPNNTNCLPVSVDTPLYFGRPSPILTEGFCNSQLDVTKSDSSHRQSPLRNDRLSPINKGRLTKRQLSQLRIQELISIIPPPAIMKIIYHMSEELDIEAKKTDSGIKFLRKNRSGTFVSTEGKTSNLAFEKSISNIEIKEEFNPIFENYQHPSIPETFIKEEKMDLDSDEMVEFDALKMLTKDLDVCDSNADLINDSSLLQSQELLVFGNSNSTLGENSQNPNDGLFRTHSRSAIHHIEQEQEQHLRQPSVQLQSCLPRRGFDRMGVSSLLNSDPNSGNSLVSRRSMSPLNFPPATVSADITMNGPPHATGAYDSSLALVPSSQSGDSAHYRNGDGCPSPQLPFSNHFSATHDRTSDKSPSFPSGSFLNCAPTAQALASGAATTVSTMMSNGHSSMNQSIASRDDSQFSLISSSLPSTSNSSSFSNFEDRYFPRASQVRSSNSFSYSDDQEASFQQPLCHSSVQRQIMTMSINSPSSPSDSNYNATGTSDKLVGHIRGQVTHLPPSAASFMPASQSSPQTAELPDRLPSCSPNKDYITMRMEAAFASPDAQCSTPFLPCSPATPSPSPSLRSSSSSNSSCENSSDVFERSLYTSPLNLSGLSDVESSVLQKFFEHVSAHLLLHRNEGKPWNSDDLLPKPFLEMLQAELESE
ncbi:Zinc finger nuclear hormone receptor-type [Trinorchestia longiramus]|nr:Zinc finger nuclear hormone receptor-type [Trinorchestia longiramus]